MRRAGALAVLCALAAPAAAQDAVRSALTGRTTDGTGGAVAGAVVRATAEATGLAVEGRSDARGNFTLQSLAPGRYTVTVEAPGLATRTYDNVRIEVGRDRRLDVALAVGGRSKTVDVDGTAAERMGPGSAVGGVVSSSDIENLPLNGRNLELAFLLAAGRSQQAVLGLAVVAAGIPVYRLFLWRKSP